jgi:lipid A 4'-phosphatase
MVVTMHTDPDREADASSRLMLVAIAALIGVLAALLFVGWPDLDIAASRLLYVEPRHFALSKSGVADTLRVGFRLLTWTASIAAIAGIALALARNRRLFGLGLSQWMFLALVLITGPGLITNTLLKDNWARPRPIQIVEFGGSAKFTPVLERSGTCARNCSFVSGEASATFALGFAIAMLTRRRRTALMAVAVVAGAVSGLIRMGEGGHFLSDVVFAGVFMALDVALMHWLVFDALAPRIEGQAWWHEKAVDIGGRLRLAAENAYDRRADWVTRHLPTSAGGLRTEDRGNAADDKPDDSIS